MRLLLLDGNTVLLVSFRDRHPISSMLAVGGFRVSPPFQRPEILLLFLNDGGTRIWFLLVNQSFFFLHIVHDGNRNSPFSAADCFLTSSSQLILTVPLFLATIGAFSRLRARIFDILWDAFLTSTRYQWDFTLQAPTTGL